MTNNLLEPAVLSFMAKKWLKGGNLRTDNLTSSPTGANYYKKQNYFKLKKNPNFSLPTIYDKYTINIG